MLTTVLFGFFLLFFLSLFQSGLEAREEKSPLIFVDPGSDTRGYI